MSSFSVTTAEPQRLDALRRMVIMHGERSGDFDALSRAAAAIFGAPIAMVSLAEGARGSFGPVIGLEHSDMTRGTPFCNHAMLGHGPLVVEDATLDERFRDEPQVAGAPGIRAYAGVPLASEGGLHVGTLCVLDTKPRRFVASEIQALENLGQLARGLLKAHGQMVRAQALAEEKAEQERLLWRKTRLLQQTERFAKVGGWELDLRTGMVHWSDEVFRIAELPVGAHVTLEQALSFYPEGPRQTASDSIERAIATGKPYEFEVEFVTALGKRKWVHTMGECEYRNGQPVRLFGIFQDVTERRNAEDKVRQLVERDELTRIANRACFNRRLAEAVEAGGATLLLMDLDGFKEINDTHGHMAGDAVLQAVAERLRETVGERGLVARIGGDEFAVVMAEKASQGAIETLSRLLFQNLHKPIDWNSESLHISASIGCAFHPDNAEGREQLVQCADLALYAAKRAGRGVLVFYSGEMSAGIEARRQAIGVVQAAIKAGRVLPHYMPKFLLKGQEHCGFEALFRVLGPKGEVIAAADLAPAFADPATARMIGDAMLELVTADMAAWQAQGLDFGRVSMNLAAADFAGGTLAQRVLGGLAAAGLAPRCFAVEITEAAILSDGPRAAAALGALHAQGVAIALDDFGTGFASLAHLRDYPIDRIKVDRSFVMGLGRKAESPVVVKSIIDLGHSLGLAVMAEGIETKGQLEFLTAAGCELGQGFLLAKPMDGEATGRYLRRLRGWGSAAAVA